MTNELMTLRQTANAGAILGSIHAIYADGGVIGGNPSQHGHTWGWVATTWNPNTHREEPMQAGYGSVALAGAGNNLAEFYAFLLALEFLPDGWSGRVYSDSANTIGRFFKGFKTNGIPVEWLTRMRTATTRLGDLTPVQLDGHPTQDQLASGVGKRGNPCSIFNVMCDKLCNYAASEFLKTQTVLNVTPLLPPVGDVSCQSHPQRVFAHPPRVLPAAPSEAQAGGYICPLTLPDPFPTLD